MCDTFWKLVVFQWFIHHSNEVNIHEALVCFKEIDRESIWTRFLSFHKGLNRIGKLPLRDRNSNILWASRKNLHGTWFNKSTKYHPFSHCIVGYCATWSREYCRPLQDRHPMWPLYCLCHIFGDKASCQTLLDQGETKKLTHPIPGFHPFGSRPDPTSILFPIHKGLKLKPVVLNVRLVNFILHSKEEQNSRDFLILASSIRRTLMNPYWAMSA